MRVIIWVCLILSSLAHQGSAMLPRGHWPLALRKFPHQCENEVDVGFLLDSSGSIKDHYDDEKSFVKSMAAAFGFGYNHGRAGVITFSKKAVLSIKLNLYTSPSSFNTAVDEIGLMNSYTRIDLALRLAQRQLFIRKNGGRPGVPKVIVLLTDGEQTKMSGYEKPEKIAKELRNAGIKLIVVGMGNGVKMAELIKIAGGAKNVFKANTFNQLLSRNFIKRVATQVCKKVCSNPICFMYCSHGRETDENGCDICRCKRPPSSVCPQMLCMMHCPHGVEKDRNGCTLCKCKRPPSSGFCVHRGKKYKAGQSTWINCNRCHCIVDSNGQGVLACTKKGCLKGVCYHDGKAYKHGERFRIDCNTCFCAVLKNGIGQIGCTLMYCNARMPDFCVDKHKTYGVGKTIKRDCNTCKCVASPRGIKGHFSCTKRQCRDI